MSLSQPRELLERTQEQWEHVTLARADIAWIAGFLAVYAHLLSGIEIGRLYAMGDFPPYYGASAFAKFLGTWHETSLGYSYLYNVLPAYLGAITTVGGVLGQNLFYLALIPAGFVSFAIFVGRFVTRRPARYLAAAIYALNPVTIGDFVNGSIAALIGFVGFPLVLHYLWRVVERDRWDDALRAGAVFGATTITTWLGFWMICPFGLYLAVRARRRPRTLAKLVAGGLLGVLLALPNVHHVLQRAGRFDEGKAVLIDTLLWNYAAADPLAVLRLAGNHGMLAMNELGYNTHPSMVVGLVIPGVALLAWQRRDVRVFFAVAAGVTAFVVLTKHGATYRLFDLLPPLWSARNPVKLQYPLALSLAVAFGAGLETVLVAVPWSARRTSLTAPRPALDRETYVSAAIVGLVALSLFAYAAPAQGALGLDEVRGDDYYVPEEYDALASDLDGPVLWVPYGYTTQLRLRHTYPEHVGIKSGGVLHGIQNAEYVTDLFADFATGEAGDGRLRKLGVQYVVVESDPPAPYGSGEPRLVEKWGAPWLWGDPASYADLLNRSSAYELQERRGNLSVYAVSNVPERATFEQRRGVHALIYPTEPSVRRLGTTRVANGEFVANLSGWWTPPAESGTRVRATIDDGEAIVEMTVNESADPLPIAQEIAVREDYPYEVLVEADGSGVLGLFWYDGAKAPENLVTSETVALSETPTRVLAKGDLLSLRVRANNSRLLVRQVSLYRTTYPERVGFSDNVDGVPGAVIDGRADATVEATNDATDDATTVAVNLDGPDAEGADVRLVDAETVLAGDLVFDPALRQGVGVRVDDDRLPFRVPGDARVVTAEDENGTVLDYWVAGAFDETPATVLYTSYDDRWDGPPGSRQFIADGWANGFTDADPDSIRWTGDAGRPLVVRLWASAWLLVGVTLLGRWRPVRQRLVGLLAALSPSVRREGGRR